jgi:arylsulfatase A-like enzyme
MYVHTIDPHVPYIPPQKYLKIYDNQPYDGPVAAAATAKIAEGIKTGRVKLNARDKIRYESLYNGEITYHDDQLILLQNKLTELGLLEETAIIITSDHGEEFFDHGSAGHGHSLYEELLHIPLIVRLPGKHTATVPARDEDEVSLVDVFPTICDILGVECPKDAAGTSLVPRLKAESKGAFPSASFSDFLYSQKTVRMGRYKLIYRGLRTTLFDLKNDPDETRDLSDEYPIALVTLRDALGTHLARFVDTPATDGAASGPAKKHKATQTVIDKETAEQLKALGYMGGP